MDDIGQILTDKALRALEWAIYEVYKEAHDDLADTIAAYFAAFSKRDAKQKALLEDGKITEGYYKQWRLNQIGRGRRYEALRDKIAERMTNANESAAVYINDAMPGIYGLNRNYATYCIDKLTGGAMSLDYGAKLGIDFTLWDENTVKRLLVERPDLMPYYPEKRAIKRGIDLAYGKKQITAQVTSSILQGDSIGKIADKLQQRVEDMNRTSAIRAARTATTEAQNAGRMNGLKEAAAMGLKVRKQWLSTLDGKTRHEHRILDGQTQDIDEPFTVDGQKIMYPCDPSAAAHLVYNCRCTLIADIDTGVEPENDVRRDNMSGEVIENMTYQEWYDRMSAQDPEKFAVGIKKQRNERTDKVQFAEYKKLLGKEVPKVFEEFQAMKYTEPDKWDYIKGFAKYERANPGGGRIFYDADVVVKKLRDSGIVNAKGRVVKPPRGVSIKDVNDHAKLRLAERGLTQQQAQKFVDGARFALKQRNGQVYAFYSSDGFSVVSTDGQLKTTGYLDEQGKTLYEEVIKYVR